MFKSTLQNVQKLLPKCSNLGCKNKQIIWITSTFEKKVTPSPTSTALPYRRYNGHRQRAVHRLSTSQPARPFSWWAEAKRRGDKAPQKKRPPSNEGGRRLLNHSGLLFRSRRENQNSIFRYT